MYERILVGTDGSATASKAVERAVQVAASHGARLTIMTADRPDRGEAVVAAAQAEHADSGVPIDTLVVGQEPVRALIDAARAGSYDLLVVGNKGTTWVGRFFRLSSVPNKVTHHLPCNLLIVKTT